MHPSVIKLILIQLSSSELMHLAFRVDEHKKKLEAIIRNKNWGGYPEAAWTQDYELTKYISNFIAKIVGKRSETPPA